MGSKYMVGINLVSDWAGARGGASRSLKLVALAACFGCSATQPDRPLQPTSAAESSPGAEGTARSSETAAVQTAEPTPSAPPPGAPTTPVSFACSSLSCTTFPRASQALAAALTNDARVIGFGEAHAPSSYAGRSTARRFAEELLPSLAPRSKRLLVELLAPPNGCEKARQEVQTESNAITEGQAETNQNDYVALGHAARQQGVTPDILRPSCRDMEVIAAVEVRVLAIMETIATLSVEVTKAWLAERSSERPLVLLYGGALHNDLEPRPHLETWSYGPRLSDLSGGRYVEVDLVVPELVLDNDSWQKFSWYEAVRSLPPGHGPTLVRVTERSFALVFAAPEK